MSATTTPITHLDLYTDLLNRMRVTLGSTAGTTTQTNYAKRYINLANHDLHVGKNWWWAERQAILQTHNGYSQGSVIIASTSRTTVTGTNTQWNTTATGMGTTWVRIGGKLRMSGENEVYIVSAVSSDTAVTLLNRYVGNQTVASANALSYSAYEYYEDEYALEPDFWRLIDARIFSSAMNIEVVPSQDFLNAFPRNFSRGKPRIATFITRAPLSNPYERQIAVLHPAPDDWYQIPYRYITNFLAVSSTGTQARDLSADTDEPIVPRHYRHVLVEGAAKLWYRDLKDDARFQAAEAAYTDLFRRMAGDMSPQDDRVKFRPRWGRYLAGVAGPRFGSTGRRLSADTRFDELRDL